MASIFDFLNGGQQQDANLMGMDQPQPQMGFDISTLSNRIQELLGAKQPDKGGMAQNILSSRFNTDGLDTGYGDYANGVVQSAMGKPTLGPQVATQRVSGMADIAHKLSQAQYYMSAGTVGKGEGAIAAQRIMAENPGMTFTDAYLLATAKQGQGVTYDPNTGTMMARTGAPQAAGAMSYGKQTGTNQSDLQYKPVIKQNEARTEKLGANQGTQEVDLANAQASMPQLEQTINNLSEIGKRATYTLAGQAGNALVRQTGMGATQGAVAREEYINTVRDVLFPQLRATFGAQFTAKEGEALVGTLGDLNKSPEEKDAALRAFIDQKKQTIGSMRRNVGGLNSPQGGPVNLTTTVAPPTADEEAEYFRLKGMQ